MNRDIVIVSCLSVAVIFVFISPIDALPGPVNCNATKEFACSSGRCLSLDLVNNSVNDCGDNSDEVANPCRSPLFSCRNDRCIMMLWVLDGNNDCIDGSDEVKRIGSPCHMVTKCCRCDDYVLHSVCANGVCRCSPGYFRNDLGTVCHQRLLGTFCASDEDCRMTMEDSSCASNECQCNAGFYSTDDRTQCIRRTLGESCNSSVDCASIEKSHCSVNLSCVCDKGYTDLDDNVTCVPVLINDTCQFDDDCLANGSVCRDYHCACPAGYYDTRSRDVCVKRFLGDACVIDDDCSDVADYAVCRDDRCACPDGRLATPERSQWQTCVATEKNKVNDDESKMTVNYSGRDIAVVAAGIVVISCLFVFDVFIIVWMLKKFVPRLKIKQQNGF